MLYKNLSFLNCLLLFIGTGKLFAADFSIRILNESSTKYERLDIIIWPENFNANRGQIMIENIKPCNILSIEVEEYELNTPLLFQGKLPNRSSNLKVQIIAVPKGKYIVNKKFKSILSEQNWKLTHCQDGKGLQVPNMNITIDKSGNIEVNFL